MKCVHTREFTSPRRKRGRYQLSKVLTCWSFAGNVHRGCVLRGLLAAPAVCAGMCQDLLLGWDIVTSGNMMGGCDLHRKGKE